MPVLQTKEIVECVSLCAEMAVRNISSMGFIGSGQMARALIKGFVRSGMLKLANLAIAKCLQHHCISQLIQ